jgi:SAM-dependent methyltransferase
MDWGIGNYERIAVELAPAAQAAIDAADPRAGERVVDVGCGTGNAALLAAERGALVTGVDPSPRLLQSARAEAAARGLEIAYVEGEAAVLPLADTHADAVTSVFGAIFAPDALAAAAEMARVTSARGRIVLCAWIPSGALFEVTRLRREALAAATDTPPGSPPFAWHTPDALKEAFGPLGFAVEAAEHTLAFTAASPREFLASELSDHPMWLSARATLEPEEKMDALSARALEIYASANEDPDGFRVTSDYVVATLRRT